MLPRVIWLSMPLTSSLFHNIFYSEALPRTTFAGWPKGIYIPKSFLSLRHTNEVKLLSPRRLKCNSLFRFYLREKKAVPNHFLLTQCLFHADACWEPAHCSYHPYTNAIVTNLISSYDLLRKRLQPFSASKEAWILRGRYLESTWSSIS